MVVGRRNNEEGGKGLLNQGRFYLPQNLIATQHWKPLAQKYQNAPLTRVERRRK